MSLESCQIEVGHVAGTAAEWRGKLPGTDYVLFVCDRHHDQYEEDGRFDHIEWERLP